MLLTLLCVICLPALMHSGGANSEVAQVARLGDSVADLLVPVLKNTSCKLHEVSIRYGLHARNGSCSI